MTENYLIFGIIYSFHVFNKVALAKKTKMKMAHDKIISCKHFYFTRNMFTFYVRRNTFFFSSKRISIKKSTSFFKKIFYLINIKSKNCLSRRKRGLFFLFLSQWISFCLNKQTRHTFYFKLNIS